MARRRSPEPGYLEDAREQDEHFLPPRKAVHPTEKEKWVKIFYRSLLGLFVALVAGLLTWGVTHYMQ
ncbi:hypothetical protein [Paenibacillus hamazuiensis]|uniref:hypothetical protein n=1 Tax=Paenibacillus hamazuiensis TaxID=2936508 RepID=UPI00200D1C6B|nr:hypothetical protein [Paenibacillus hamazuiensis]